MIRTLSNCRSARGFIEIIILIWTWITSAEFSSDTMQECGEEKLHPEKLKLYELSEEWKEFNNFTVAADSHTKDGEKKI